MTEQKRDRDRKRQLELSRGARDVILFFGGIAGVAYETIHEHSDRPYLLTLFAGMMGLTLFLRKNGM